MSEFQVLVPKFYQNRQKNRLEKQDRTIFKFGDCISLTFNLSWVTPRVPEIVAHDLEQAKGTCTFDFKPLGSGLLGKEQKSTGKFIHSPYTELYYGIRNPFSL